MRKIIIIAVALLMVVGIGSAFAANSLQSGSKGISVGMGDSVFSHKTVPAANGIVNDVVNINGRYFVSKDMAITGGFGLQVDSGDADATYFSLSFGARKYLRTDDFAPFIAGQFTFASVQADPNIADITLFDLSALFGAEYFFSKQFSLEGAIGVGFGQANDGINDVDDTYFGTRTVGVMANFYF